MSDDIKISVFGDRQIVLALSSLTDRIQKKLVRTVYRLVNDVQRNVVDNHLSGPTAAHSLKRISGNLARSVHTLVQDLGGLAIIGKIFYTADVPYARIHELGGVIHVPEIVPDKAQALAFMSGGKNFVVARTRAHDVVMPERAPLRTGFEELVDQIRDGLYDAVHEEAKVT